MLPWSPRASCESTLVPTVVSMPNSRKWRPSAMESLTEPPLESSTMVAPRRSRLLANSSKALGLSAVTTPTALTQPRQLGSHATQLNFIGSLRSSRLLPACAGLPNSAAAPGKAKQNAAAQNSAQPRRSADFKIFKLVPSPSPQAGSGKPQLNALRLYHRGVTKWYPGEYASSIVTCCTATKTSAKWRECGAIANTSGSLLRNST